MSGNHPGLSNNFSRSGEKFSWSKDNLRSIKNIISKYPKGREQSAVMPLLYLAQEQNNNWISIECIETIAETLNMPKIRVTEVASFYSMYNTRPLEKILFRFVEPLLVGLEVQIRLQKLFVKKQNVKLMIPVTIINLQLLK